METAVTNFKSIIIRQVAWRVYLASSYVYRIGAPGNYGFSFIIKLDIQSMALLRRPVIAFSRLDITQLGSLTGLPCLTKTRR